MNRVASTILVACGAALLATRLISPAGSAPRVSGPQTPDSRVDQDPTVEAVKTEVSRLRERTKSDPGNPAPVRDPFNFGRQPQRPRTVIPPPELSQQVGRQVMLPGLVAIVTDNKGDVLKRSAALTRGDGVEFVSAGDEVGAFRVEAITADDVVLVDRETGLRYRIAVE